MKQLYERETRKPDPATDASEALAPRHDVTPGVRRPSGTVLLLGLVLGALLVQGAVLGYLHWEDSRAHTAQGPMALWESVINAHVAGMTGAGQPTRDTGRAFYPPPGWDNGLLADPPAPTTEATRGNPFTLDALLSFLQQLGGQATPDTAASRQFVDSEARDQAALPSDHQAALRTP